MASWGTLEPTFLDPLGSLVDEEQLLSRYNRRSHEQQRARAARVKNGVLLKKGVQTLPMSINSNKRRDRAPLGSPALHGTSFRGPLHPFTRAFQVFSPSQGLENLAHGLRSPPRLANYFASNLCF